MKRRIGLWGAGLALLIGGNVAVFATTLSRTTLTKLATLRAGHSLVITGFPAGPTRIATLRFERVEVYAPGAHIYAIGTGGKQELPKSRLIFLRAYSDDGSVRVALTFNPDGSFSDGSGEGPEGSFELSGAMAASGATLLSARSLASVAPAGAKLNFTCGNEFENLDVRGLHRLLPGAAPSAVSAPAAASHALRIATVAVDTDSAFMSNLFSNNTTNATNWIAKMFNAMNTMYERDLLVNLEQGDTTLRTSSGGDPYTGLTFPADTNDLNTFGTWWQTNKSGVSRTFATLLSGIGPCSSGCSASGIAWLGSYCQTSSGGGSYSVVEVFSQLSVDPNAAIAARLDGHELGHNFGADHTHCTDISTGASRVATNTIDKCYNGEATSGCYSGATSCPASGPGAPAGTIMSYCNIKGCGSGGQNVLQFHPTQITDVLLPDITSTISNQPGCLNTTDDIFYDGFEN
jgi:hypothetical protein